MYNILICDDEPDILSALRIYLKSDGYAVFEAATGRQALDIIEQNASDPNAAIHLVLLDIMMPGLDGITTTALLREKYNIPVILLTAKSEDADKVLGLGIGADDYVTKPFVPAELLARVKAQIRRYAFLGGMTKTDGTLTVGEITLDDSAKTVTLSGEAQSLTPREYDILRFLMLSPGKVFSSEEIYKGVWKELPLGAEGAVAVHIRHLREKLEIDPANPRYIKVVWGKGYKISDNK